MKGTCGGMVGALEAPNKFERRLSVLFESGTLSGFVLLHGANRIIAKGHDSSRCLALDADKFAHYLRLPADRPDDHASTTSPSFVVGHDNPTKYHLIWRSPSSLCAISDRQVLPTHASNFTVLIMPPSEWRAHTLSGEGKEFSPRSFPLISWLWHASVVRCFLSR